MGSASKLYQHLKEEHCSQAAKILSEYGTSNLKQHGYPLFLQQNQYLHLDLSYILEHHLPCRILPCGHLMQLPGNWVYLLS
uniref:Glycosyltransferase n=1 Tax=Rhizophora mucronata TaxID=61149 RepID=A0A2P2PAF8_RHIMU